MKTITIAGYIGKDATTRATQKGDSVTGFSVGVRDGWGDNERTMWFDCSWWGNRAAKFGLHLSKGMPITVSGELSWREYEGKTYHTIRVNDVTPMGKNNRQGAGDSNGPGYDQNKTGYDAQHPNGGGYPQGGSTAGGGMDDEIPFAPERRV